MAELLLKHLSPRAQIPLTSRSAQKEADVAKEIQAKGGGRTKVLGYQLEIRDVNPVNALWDDIARDGIQVDVLILNTTDLVPLAADGTLFESFNLG